MELIKLNNKYFPVVKNKMYVDFESTSITVDGKVFTNTEGAIKYFNSLDNFNQSPSEEISVEYGYNAYTKGRWYTRLFDMLIPFGVPELYLWDYHGFTMYLNDRNITKYSDCEDVNILCNLHNWNVIGKSKIKSIHTASCKEYKNNDIAQILKDNSIFFKIHNYGYNYAVWIEYNLMHFIKSDFSLFYKSDLSEYYKLLFSELNKLDKTLFPKKLFENKLSDIQLNDIAIRILNAKINQKMRAFCKTY